MNDDALFTDHDTAVNDSTHTPSTYHSTPLLNGVVPFINDQSTLQHLDAPAPPSAPKPRIYCLNTEPHPRSRPSASQDLVSLYSLTPFANQVVRIDPRTGIKNTMRKSYQGHIKDIPGKNIIKPDSMIRDVLRVPEGEVDTFVGPRNIRRLERETLLEGFNVLPGVIPDFDPSLLGLDDDLSDQFDGPNHRDGEDGDLFNGKVRKKKRRSEDMDVDALSSDDRKKKRKKTVQRSSNYNADDTVQ